MKKLTMIVCLSTIITSLILFNIYNNSINKNTTTNLNTSATISEITNMKNSINTNDSADIIETNDNIETNDITDKAIDSTINLIVDSNLDTKSTASKDTEDTEDTINIDYDIDNVDFEDDIEIIYNSDVDSYDGINDNDENIEYKEYSNIEDDLNDSIDTIKHSGYDHYDNWIWVGDSRTVGMGSNIGLYYLAKSAEGLTWFRSVSNELYDLEGYNIILNFGINDWWNVIDYANFYNNMPEQVFQKNKVFFMSVNPVDESCGYYGFNSTVNWFNENLKNNLRNDIIYIDTYSYLLNNGFNTIDGIHYDYNTDVKIYNYTVNTILGDS